METHLHSIADRIDAPFFYYEIDQLEAHLRALQTPPWLRLWYACKANPLSHVLKAAERARFGFDAASEGELNQLLRQGIDPGRILMTGPGKLARLLERAVEQGVGVFVVESPRELEVLEALGQPVQALLRLQLPGDSSEANVLGGGAPTPFGMAPADWQAVDCRELHSAQVVGFHCFQWGNTLSVEALVGYWQRIGAAASALARAMGIELDVLDLGGGLGVPYAQGQQLPDWSDAVTALERVREQCGAKALWLELGRYAVGPFGTYACRVVDRKATHGENFLVLEGGINHLLRSALTGQAFPCRLLRSSSAPTQPFQAHGPLCTALDKLASCHLPGDVEPGDWLLFGQCGAYGFTESMPFFLCHDLPAEVVVEGDLWQVARPAQTAEDWLC